MLSARTCLVAGIGVAFASLAGMRPAWACGASVGGVPGTCNVEEASEELRPKYHAGAGGTFTSTSLRFGGSHRVDQTRWIAAASFELRPLPNLFVSFGAGGLVAGHMSGDGLRTEFQPGFVGSAGVSYRFLDAAGARPFVVGSLQLATVVAHTSIAGEAAVGYEAIDIRGGVAAGWALARALSVYGVARAFGGPIFWRERGEALLGTDAYHFQLGVGLSVTPVRHVDLFLEGIPLGEAGVSLGGGASF